MSQTCRDCSRVNPSEAAYCYFDGAQLNGRADLPADGSSVSFTNWVFPSPFVFPSGDRCRNFPQLARACRKDPQAAGEVLAGGFLESFLGSLGRVDLALAAREAARHPDRDRGLDDFLAKLPGTDLEPARLEVEPGEVDLGSVPLGAEPRFELVLRNAGERLVYGTAAADECPWLVLGDSGAAEKLFQFTDRITLPVRVRGDRLRAYTKPHKGEIVVESNGGNVIVTVSVMVPIKPFAQGVLAGAVTPRQLAEKAKAHPNEAAALIESGAVTRWYEANGWAYPVQGPSASGFAAVQQLFEALGLVKPPKVALVEPALALAGRPGERLDCAITVTTSENRAVFAHAVSDQPWLTVGKAVYRGRTATLPLTIAAVPREPGKSLRARVKVTANGNQRFDVPLALAVADVPVGTPGVAHPTAAVSAPIVPTEVTPAPEADPFADLDAPAPAADVELVAAAVAAPAAPPTPATVPVRTAILRRWRQWLPLAIVLVGLLTAVGRDLLFHEPEGTPELPPIDEAHPRVVLMVHDALQPSDFVAAPTMRFGLLMPDPNDPKDEQKFKKLTYDRLGRTANTCVRVDRTEFLLGLPQGGRWEEPIKQPLGKDPLEGNRTRIGWKSKWLYAGRPDVTIEQQVEVVPGGLSADGKSRLLDTCLVRYAVANNDTVAHLIGLRFLLDTYIGANDGVPFTIPGDKELCDTCKEFDRAERVPDFVSALEKQDVKNPGTVAHVSLKVGGDLEPPSRVILGAWPNRELLKVDAVRGGKAQGQNTGWDVPVMSMQEPVLKSKENPDGDSAVTLYWDEKDLPAKQTRVLGFAYGLGSVTGEGKGTLGLATGGELLVGREFSLTAYVRDPVPNQTVTLKLPHALTLVAGKEKEPVPPGAGGQYSTVTWRVKAEKQGVFTVRLTSSTGGSVEHRLPIKQVGVFKNRE